MTPEAQRIAIAEACGWTHLRFAGLTHPNPLWGTAPNTDYANLASHWYAGCPGDSTNVPDYLNDLNAMHEAEWADGGVTVKAMRFWLWHICDEMTGHSASAAQRAEAFLRAKGLWVDSTEPVPA